MRAPASIKRANGCFHPYSFITQPNLIGRNMDFNSSLSSNSLYFSCKEFPDQLTASDDSQCSETVKSTESPVRKLGRFKVSSPTRAHETNGRYRLQETLKTLNKDEALYLEPYTTVTTLSRIKRTETQRERRCEVVPELEKQIPFAGSWIQLYRRIELEEDARAVRNIQLQGQKGLSSLSPLSDGHRSHQSIRALKKVCFTTSIKDMQAPEEGSQLAISNTRTMHVEHALVHPEPRSDRYSSQRTLSHHEHRGIERALAPYEPCISNSSCVLEAYEPTESGRIDNSQEITVINSDEEADEPVLFPSTAETASEQIQVQIKRTIKDTKTIVLQYHTNKEHGSYRPSQLSLQEAKQRYDIMKASYPRKLDYPHFPPSMILPPGPGGLVEFTSGNWLVDLIEQKIGYVSLLACDAQFPTLVSLEQLNLPDNKGLTPLLALLKPDTSKSYDEKLASSKNYDVKLLLNRGADFLYLDPCGENAFMYAARNGNTKAIRWIFDKYQEMFCEKDPFILKIAPLKPYEDVAINYAIQQFQGFTEDIRSYFQNDPFLHVKEEDTEYWDAESREIYDYVLTIRSIKRTILKRMLPHIANQEGKNALCLAVEGGHLKAVRLLCEKMGAEPFSYDSAKPENIPLRLAARHGHTSICTYLIKQSVDNDQLSKHLAFAVFDAVDSRASPDTIILLLKAFAARFGSIDALSPMVDRDIKSELVARGMTKVLVMMLNFKLIEPERELLELAAIAGRPMLVRKLIHERGQDHKACSGCLALSSTKYRPEKMHNELLGVLRTVILSETPDITIVEIMIRKLAQGSGDKGKLNVYPYHQLIELANKRGHDQVVDALNTGLLNAVRLRV